MPTNNQVSLRQLVEELAQNRALDLRGYKPTSLERRIRKRMCEIKVPSYAEYLERIHHDPRETDVLLNTILINVTEFFRDPQAWEMLRTQVLPQLLRRLKPGDTLRAWSAGCASGEEPYSLAILISEFFGDKLPDYDIKIYATDIDEEALNVARRGEYTADGLRRVRPEWRERYFKGGHRLRINREQRRLVIFGVSNLVSNAPIAHCQLIICRNVLIYFDTATQRQILSRFHYALEPGGVLFLGKAESKLGESRFFRPMNLRWRLFQRSDGGPEVALPAVPSDEIHSKAMDNDEKLKILQLYHRSVLDTLQSGIMELDDGDVVVAHNDAVSAIWAIAGAGLKGKRLQNTEIVARCPEISSRLEQSHNQTDALEFQCTMRANSEEHLVHVTIRPIVSPEGQRSGTVIHCNDISAEEKLQTTIEQLEATGEELQSSNEELETTNEELQSTNEELETTNEELQSTNEELETTNEELQSLNEELENMNDELELRTRELNELSTRYGETLRRMPWPVMLVGPDENIQIWNAAAQKLFGVGTTSVVGVPLDHLPIDDSLRRALVRRSRAVLKSQKPAVLRGQSFRAGSSSQLFDVHFTPISRETSLEGVLIMFASSPAPAAPGNRNRRDGASRKSRPPAAQRTARRKRK